MGYHLGAQFTPALEVLRDPVWGTPSHLSNPETKPGWNAVLLENTEPFTHWAEFSNPWAKFSPRTASGHKFKR